MLPVKYAGRILVSRRSVSALSSAALASLPRVKAWMSTL
jgi:hypothetical protein